MTMCVEMLSDTEEVKLQKAKTSLDTEIEHFSKGKKKAVLHPVALTVIRDYRTCHLYI